MLNWPATFLVIAVGAAMLGFTNVAGSAIEIAQVLFVVFLVLAVMAFVFGRRLSIKSKNKAVK